MGLFLRAQGSEALKWAQRPISGRGYRAAGDGASLVAFLQTDTYWRTQILKIPKKHTPIRIRKQKILKNQLLISPPESIHTSYAEPILGCPRRDTQARRDTQVLFHSQKRHSGPMGFVFVCPKTTSFLFVFDFGQREMDSEGER